MPNAPFIIVGTKADTRDDPAMKGKSFVSHDEGNQLAKELSARAFIECSALTQNNLKSVFDEAIRQALNKDTGKKAKKGGCVVL